MKKNQLLIMPRTVEVVGDWYYFQLGIAYISAALKKEGFNVFTLNLNTNEGNIEELIKKAIQENNINIVSIGGLSVHYSSIKAILDLVKKINKKIKTIVGGGIISSDPVTAMTALESADFGVIGEGEVTICELTKTIEENGDLSKVDGIIFRQNSDLIQTKQRKEIEDLDLIPFPDYKGFDFDKTISLESNCWDLNEKNSIDMISSRSCPFRCTFCFHTSGQKFRQRSLNNFFEELDSLVQEYKIKYIYILDELFTYNEKRVNEFCKRIKKYDLNWGVAARVTDITEELVQTLKEANCVTIYLGIESADNKILKSMNKHITIEQTEKALEIIYKSGIHICGAFIFGDKEETIETAKTTLNWWKKNSKYGLFLNFITTYPGTELYKYALKNNIITDPVQFLQDGCPTVNVSKMSEDEVKYVAAEVINSSKSNLKQPQNLKNFEHDSSGSRVSFQGKCCNCGEINNWKNIKLLYKSNICCSKCGTKHKVPLHQDIIKKMNTNIGLLLKTYEKIAFWGITDFTLELLESIDFSYQDKIFYTDSSKMKQKALINKKKVENPSIIEKEKIKLVVVPVLSCYRQIELQVQKEHKIVKKLIPMIELMN